ncbi:hypothetical protein [Cognatishimia sp.]|uniref:hypothetical protein n=1 Tax=Cognatishimia sp. TaxID=2211648 RepID=UPI003511ED62
MPADVERQKVIAAAQAGNAAWEDDNFGEDHRQTYIESLEAVREGLAYFISDEGLREFLDSVLHAELQGALHIVVKPVH